MAALVDTDRLATYDAEGVAPYINDFSCKKLTSTVSGNTVSFTDAKIGVSASAVILDGPYIANQLVGVNNATISGNTVTYTLNNSNANNSKAIIWIRSGLTNMTNGVYFGTSVGFSNITNIWVEDA